MAIWIMNFPLPPSVNEYLMPVSSGIKYNRQGKPYRSARLVKTPVHRQFRDLCYLWAANNRSGFEPLKAEMHACKQRMELNQGYAAFRVDCFFALELSRIFTKDKKLEQIDADNFLKPLRDGLAAILEIDDRAFFAGNCEKVMTTSKESQCSVLRIEPMRPRTLDQIRTLMRQETTTVGS